jgi:hypothetical protein
MGFIHLQIERNPWLEGYRPQIPIMSALCPERNLLNPLQKKFLGTPLLEARDKWSLIVMHCSVIYISLCLTFFKMQLGKL